MTRWFVGIYENIRNKKYIFHFHAFPILCTFQLNQKLRLKRSRLSNIKYYLVLLICCDRCGIELKKYNIANFSLVRFRISQAEWYMKTIRNLPGVLLYKQLSKGWRSVELVLITTVQKTVYNTPLNLVFGFDKTTPIVKKSYTGFIQGSHSY